MSDFKQGLIEAQLEIIEAYEKVLSDAPFEQQAIVKDIIAVQKTIARKLGYRSKVETEKSAPPPKDFFKKRRINDGEVLSTEIKGIKNDNVNTTLFDKSKDDVISTPKPIENKNINVDAFKENPAVAELRAKQKDNPRRISQTQKNEIEQLANEGLNAKEISDKLLIVQSKIDVVLSKMNKGSGNLITTNAKDKSLENEIKDFRE